MVNDGLSFALRGRGIASGCRSPVADWPVRAGRTISSIVSGETEETMRIAIIGAGNVGQALGKGWAKCGHEVRYGVPDPNGAKYRDLPAMTAAEAAVGADAIVLATPWPATEAAVRGLGDLANRIVIDCTNPLGVTADGLGLIVGFSNSGGELVAGWAVGAAVFKAFNTTGYKNMEDAAGYTPVPAMFVAGDDEAKKPAVLGLVRDLGFAAIDAGPLRNARLLEPYGMLWIDQARNRGAGLDFAFAVIRKGE
jgi:predicted dinucleotide-binding enzyme